MIDQNRPIPNSVRWVQTLSASAVAVSAILYFTFSYGVQGQVQFLVSAASQILEKLGLI